MPGVARTSETSGQRTTSLPDLSFSVVDGAAESHAAVPTLRFTLEVGSRNRIPIHSALLNAQVPITAAQRPYDVSEQARLVEIFGTPDRWGVTMRSLHWTQATIVLPRFDDRCTAALLVPCTYDFELVIAKYLHGLIEGEVPLDFL